MRRVRRRASGDLVETCRLVGIGGRTLHAGCRAARDDPARPRRRLRTDGTMAATSRSWRWGAHALHRPAVWEPPSRCPATGSRGAARLTGSARSGPMPATIVPCASSTATATAVRPLHGRPGRCPRARDRGRCRAILAPGGHLVSERHRRWSRRTRPMRPSACIPTMPPRSQRASGVDRGLGLGPASRGDRRDRRSTSIACSRRSRTSWTTWRRNPALDRRRQAGHPALSLGCGDARRTGHAPRGAADRGLPVDPLSWRPSMGARRP